MIKLSTASFGGIQRQFSRISKCTHRHFVSSTKSVACQKAGSKNSIEQNIDNNVPLLLTRSGKTENEIKESISAPRGKQSVEQVTLIETIFQKKPQENDPYRGYTLLCNTDSSKFPPDTGRDWNTVHVKPKQQRKPLWFIFCGMGCQWEGMGKELIQNFRVYEESIAQSASVLESKYGCKLYPLLEKGASSIFSNIQDAFVVNLSTQIALVQVLKSLGVQPDGYMGHSTGELLCAMVDESLTPEQVISLAWLRGECFNESKGLALGQGGMASVNFSWAEAKKKCPPTIHPACHNSPTNVTISGPKKDITKFLQDLRKQNIFGVEVNTCGRAAHCKYLQDIKDKLLTSFKEVVTNPKPKSSKWISTSQPKKTNLIADTDYHVFNVLNPVHFKDAVEKIPKGSMILEIGSQDLLQTPIRKTLKPPTEYVFLPSLMANAKPEVCKVSQFLHAIGILFNSGVNLDASKLYSE